MFQNAALFPHLTVRQNLGYGRWFAGRSGLAMDEVVDLLDLGPLLARRPGTLSGGERSRTAIGRALLSDPVLDHVAAVSCGIYAGQPVLDLDYAEDSQAGVDGNFVMTGAARLIEVQMSAEGGTFSRSQMDDLLNLAEAGIAALVAAQKAAMV